MNKDVNQARVPSDKILNSCLGVSFLNIQYTM